MSARQLPPYEPPMIFKADDYFVQSEAEDVLQITKNDTDTDKWYSKWYINVLTCQTVFCKVSSEYFNIVIYTCKYKYKTFFSRLGYLNIEINFIKIIYT